MRRNWLSRERLGALKSIRWIGVMLAARHGVEDPGVTGREEALADSGENHHSHVPGFPGYYRRDVHLVAARKYRDRVQT